MDVSKPTDINALRLSHQISAPVKTGGQTQGGAAAASSASSFSEVMQSEFQKSSVRFSKHAVQRMESRGVELTQGLMNNLNQAVDKARGKGSKDVAVIGNDNAFIVNIPNNTVITAMTALEMRENIFTNIDSAVLM